MKAAQLVDVCSVFFRYYFSKLPAVINHDGWDVSALLATTRWLCKKEFMDAGVVVLAFDESLGSGFRHEINPQYKANRALPSEDIIYQLELLKSIGQYLGFVVLASHEFEADDLIASAVAQLPEHTCTIYTRDKDLRQLVAASVTILDFTNEVCWTPEYVLEKMAIRPAQVPLYLALVGDASDNIEGVPGVGDKTARVLLQAFEDWPTLLGSLQQNNTLAIRGGARIRQSLLDNEGRVQENLSLTKLRCDAPINLQAESFTHENWLILNALLEHLGLQSPLRKSMQLVSGYLP